MAIHARTRVHRLLKMVLIPIVFFFVIQSVTAETERSIVLEEKYFQCKGNLKAVDDQNVSLKENIKKKDKKILELLKKKEILDHCNVKFTELGEKVSKMFTERNKTVPEKCTAFEGLSSEINNMQTRIVHQLDEVKKITIQRHKRLARGVKTNIYPDMMSVNVQVNLTEYDCKIVKKRYRTETNNILRIIEQRKWPLDRFQKQKVDHYVDGCKLRRPYILFRELVSWDEAMLRCAKRRMSLASVKTQEDSDAMEEVMKGTEYAWIGAISYRGHWVWPDGPYTLTNFWAKGLHLENVAKGFKCVCVWSIRRYMENFPCTKELYYVCQSTGDF